MNRTIDFEFITPLFSHGATDDPEVRPSSIRGALHEWFRLLGGDIVSERRVFGGIKQKNATYKDHNVTAASSVVVRVADVKGKSVEFPTLPHKSGGRAAPRKAFLAGTTCRVMLSSRFSEMLEEDERRFSSSLKAWLLMGTLGYRATRAAGSFVWRDAAFEMPMERLEYEDACRNLLDECDASKNVKVAVLDVSYSTSEEARRIVSDSLGGPERNGQYDLRDLHDPLGRIFGGRKTSPLKYRIVKLESGFHILALWDNRSSVTGNRESDFYGVIDLLERKKPRLGEQLKKAFW